MHVHLSNTPPTVKRCFVLATIVITLGLPTHETIANSVYRHEATTVGTLLEKIQNRLAELAAQPIMRVALLDGQTAALQLQPAATVPPGAERGHVDWGDGTREIVYQPVPETRFATHVYRTSGSFIVSYTDTENRTATHTIRVRQ